MSSALSISTAGILSQGIPAPTDWYARYRADSLAAGYSGSTILDSSGNNRHSTQHGALVNGSDIGTRNGFRQMFLTSGPPQVWPPISSDWTIVLMVKAYSNGTGNELLFWTASSGGMSMTQLGQIAGQAGNRGQAGGFAVNKPTPVILRVPFGVQRHAAEANVRKYGEQIPLPPDNNGGINEYPVQAIMGRFLNGSGTTVGELGLFNRLLSDDECVALEEELRSYYGIAPIPKAVVSKPLSLWWRNDSVSGNVGQNGNNNVLVDKSGNGRNSSPTFRFWGINSTGIYGNPYGWADGQMITQGNGSPSRSGTTSLTGMSGETTIVSVFTRPQSVYVDDNRIWSLNTADQGGEGRIQFWPHMRYTGQSPQMTGWQDVTHSGNGGASAGVFLTITRIPASGTSITTRVNGVQSPSVVSAGGPVVPTGIHNKIGACSSSELRVYDGLLSDAECVALETELMNYYGMRA